MDGESSASARLKQQSTNEDLRERAIREELRQLHVRIDEIERTAKARIAEEGELTKKRISEIYRRYPYDPNSASAQRSLQLKFSDKIPQRLMTGEAIKGEGDAFIEVALVDRLTGNIVDIGPEAYANVEVVLLKGDFAASEGDDWTSGTFNENIVREVEGKTPFLIGNVNLELQKGVAVLRDVKFKHGTIKIKPAVFRLGARVVDATVANGIGVIKEATTESFSLVYYHKKYVEKYSAPLLSDNVYRLINIAKNGATAGSLQDEKILTVEDFLIQLLIDPEKLKKIFNLGKSKWDATVKNARACRNANDRMYCYINPDQTIGVVFDIFGQVQGLYMGNQIIAKNMLSDVLKVHAEKLLPIAYKNWKGCVVGFSDGMALQQHVMNRIRSFSTTAGSSNTLGQASNASPGTTIGGSSSTIRSFQNIYAGDAAAEAFGGMTRQRSNPDTNLFSQELTVLCGENSLQLFDASGTSTTHTVSRTTTCDEPTMDSEVWLHTMIDQMRSEPSAMVDQTSEMDQPDRYYS